MHSNLTYSQQDNTTRKIPDHSQPGMIAQIAPYIGSDAQNIFLNT